MKPCTCETCLATKRGRVLAKPCRWKNFTMPQIRHVFGKPIALDIANAQPMTMPAVGVFYLDYTYGSGSSDK